MKDYLRKLALELGLESELEAALSKLEVRSDYEVQIDTIHEERAFDDPHSDETDRRSDFLISFGEA